MKIIVGLGNPGDNYRRTRHNAGWIFLDALTAGETWKENKKFSALICETNSAIIVKPLTYMNESGISVRKIMDFYGLLPKRLGLFGKKDADLTEVLTVVQDELDVDFGKIKTATDSGSAGHRGIESIISHLQTKKFKRLRLGIKNEFLKTRIPPEKFVLQNFTTEELTSLEKLASNYSLNDL